MKKNISLDLLKELNPIINKNLDLVSVTEDENCLWFIRDRDESSSFYFKIEYSQSIFYKYIITGKPHSNNNNNPFRLNVSDNLNIKFKLEDWINILRSYSEIDFISNLESLKKNFSEEFNSKSFESENLNEHEKSFINDYLNRIISLIPQLKSNCSTEDEKTILNDILEEAEDIQERIEVENKSQIYNSLKKLLNIIVNVTPEFIKLILVNTASGVLVRLMLGA